MDTAKILFRIDLCVFVLVVCTGVMSIRNGGQHTALRSLGEANATALMDAVDQFSRTNAGEMPKAIADLAPHYLPGRIMHADSQPFQEVMEAFYVKTENNNFNPLIVPRYAFPGLQGTHGAVKVRVEAISARRIAELDPKDWRGQRS